MMIEQNTNYAYKLKYMDNPTFDKVRDLSTKFYRELPQALQDELYEALNRGIDILDSEPQMTAYLFAFGKMHQAKLNYAFGKLPKEFLEQPEINIIDYGCGQALGTMCYADFLREKGYSQKVKTISLIEPSEICLKRSALHAAAFFPDAEIKTVNKKFDELTQDDIVCSEETPTLHILSNVLDVLNFDLDKFSILIKDSLKGYNQFVCVGPYFNYSVKDERMKKICSLIQGKEHFFKTSDKNEFVKDKDWTAQILCFSTSELLEEELSTEVTDEDIKNGIEDEFGAIYSRDGNMLLVCKSHDIESYYIKPGTKVICDKAFYFDEIFVYPYTTALKVVNIPDSVIYIGEDAFGCCANLQQINIPNAVTQIGQYAFFRCYSLERVFIPNSITIIGYRVFWMCTSLKQVVLPNTITLIGDEAFGVCTSLQQITIPDSVTSLGEKVFEECTSLKQITIPNSVTSIGERTFAMCSSLQQIFISNSVTNIENETFRNCTSLKEILLPTSAKNIGDNAFASCSALQKIIIPNSVNSIGKCAFHSCVSLKQITIPNSVTSIGEGAFASCSALQKIIIPNSVKSIGEGAFSGCVSLKQITIPNSVTNIGDAIFFECTSLQQISISNSVTGIGKESFYGCTSLEEITIPASAKYIGQYAFAKCSNLRQITIPNSVTYIGSCSFEGCISLKKVIMSDSITSIEVYTFSRCASLQQINIPDSVKHIGYGAFSFCSSLKQIIIPKGSLEHFKEMLDKNLWDKLVEK